MPEEMLTLMQSPRSKNQTKSLNRPAVLLQWWFSGIRCACAENNDVTQHVVARASLYIGFGGRIEGDFSEFYPHAEVLPDRSHQGGAHDVHQPPRQGGGKVRVINPAAQEVEEVNGHCEVQALLSPADEVQQAQRTAKHRLINKLCCDHGKGDLAKATSCCC